MKTTLNLNDALLTEAKTFAAQQTTSLTRLIDEGLHRCLRTQQTPARPMRPPVYRGTGGLAPGLDGLSNKAMQNVADQDA